jgi:hypothetical protein
VLLVKDYVLSEIKLELVQNVLRRAGFGPLLAYVVPWQRVLKHGDLGLHIISTSASLKSKHQLHNGY